MRAFKIHGDSVRAGRAIAAGETIDESPVLVMPAVQGRILAHTDLKPLLDEWPTGRGTIAFMFGSAGLYKRGADANARLEKRPDQQAVAVVATRDIDDGAEIVVDEPAPSAALQPRPLWSNRIVVSIWRRGRELRHRGQMIGADQL